MFAEALDIADNVGGDDSPALVQRDKLRVNTRMRMVARINPAKYGDRLEITNTEAEAKAMTDEELLASVRSALVKLDVPEEVLAALTIPPFGHEPPPPKKLH